MTVPNAQDVFIVFYAQSDSCDFIIANFTECVTDQCEEKVFP